jgi:predicted site-specific integrase-resolvase
MATIEVAGGEPLITPAQLAALFKVNTRTAARWAKAGKLHAVRTPDGYRRFFENEARAFMRGEAWELPGWYQAEAA